MTVSELLIVCLFKDSSSVLVQGVVTVSQTVNGSLGLVRLEEVEQLCGSALGKQALTGRGPLQPT